MFTASAPVTLNLALQGGGAHGAYTWGVLDALLEDGRFSFEGLSGTSAGAMNAVFFAQGWMDGGPAGARTALAGLWQAVVDSAPFASGDGAGLPAALRGMLQWTDYLSPGQFNPLDLNPLRDIVAAGIDFPRLRRLCPLRLFVAATHANSGKLRIFRNAELDVDPLLASACLPTLHHTVVINGEPYWDGGYSANPAVFPLFHECASPDILLVLLAPLKYAETPASAQDIRHRLQDLAFNANFLREMRMFAHLREQTANRWLPLGALERRLQRVRFHAIDAGAELGQLPGDSRLNTRRDFILSLRDAGREHARGWLAAHGEAPGKRASLDLGKVFY
jgi:NTE family protein